MYDEMRFLNLVDKGNFDEVRRLIRNGEDIHQENENGDNALLIAAKKGYVEIVTLMLEAGSHIYSTNRYGHNSLIVAAMECHLDVVRVILEFSKKISTRSAPSVVAVMAANSLEARGCRDVAELLISQPG